MGCVEDFKEVTPDISNAHDALKSPAVIGHGIKVMIGQSLFVGGVY